MLVVDASVLSTALADDSAVGSRVRARLLGQELAAPELVDLEVASVLRRLHRTGRITADRARLALEDLRDLPFDRAQHRPLVARCWELRGNLTAYDAAYVALAEALDCTLVTSDGPLSRAPGLRCDVEVLS